MSFLKANPAEGDRNPQSVEQLVTAGWTIQSDGPSGTQLIGPRKMKILDKVCLIGGAASLLFSWILGLVLVAVALVDFYVLTKRETKFISK